MLMWPFGALDEMDTVPEVSASTHQQILVSIHMDIRIFKCKHICTITLVRYIPFKNTSKHTHKCTYVYVYICMYICMYVPMYVCMYVCMYVYIHTYTIHLCIYIDVYLCV